LYFLKFKKDKKGKFKNGKARANKPIKNIIINNFALPKINEKNPHVFLNKQLKKSAKLKRFLSLQNFLFI
jgi:hypothetical protein